MFWEALRGHVTHAEDLAALARAADRRARHIHAEALYRDAVAGGDLNARTRLAGWLDERPGREAEVEQVYRDAVAAGDPTARTRLAD